MLTEKLTARKKSLVFILLLMYFVVGFFLLVIFLGEYLGANVGGIVSLLYLVAGWYFLVKRNGLFDILRIKHT